MFHVTHFLPKDISLPPSSPRILRASRNPKPDFRRQVSRPKESTDTPEHTPQITLKTI